MWYLPESQILKDTGVRGAEKKCTLRLPAKLQFTEGRKEQVPMATPIQVSLVPPFTHQTATQKVRKAEDG